MTVIVDKLDAKAEHMNAAPIKTPLIKKTILIPNVLPSNGAIGPVDDFSIKQL